MRTYKIVSNQGVDMGAFEAESPEGALEAMSRDAGYKSYADGCNAVGASTDDWTTDEWAFKNGRFGLLVTEVES